MSYARGIALALLAAACAVVCTSCGPRMVTAPSIRPYGRQPIMPPAGITPTTGRAQTLVAQQALVAANPLPRTKDNLWNGKVYYGYYCVMCHGSKGDGNGPVGVAYVPKAADLTSRRVAGLSDGELYRRMLTGTGHDPVMIWTVAPGERWPLVMYVRSLGKQHKTAGL